MKNEKQQENFKSVEVGYHSSNRYGDISDILEELIDSLVYFTPG